MKTNNKLSACILRGSTGVLLFSCVLVALCSAINLPEQPPKALPPQDNAAFGANAHERRSLSFADRVAYQELHLARFPQDKPASERFVRTT